MNDIIEALEKKVIKAKRRGAREQELNELTYRLWVAEQYAKLCGPLKELGEPPSHATPAHAFLEIDETDGGDDYV